MLFTWEYDHVRGGAVVHATVPGGDPVEVARANNGNVAQVICNGLAAQHTGIPYAPRVKPNDARPHAMMTWLGYVNPPRPDVDEDANERRWLKAHGLY